MSERQDILDDEALAAEYVLRLLDTQAEKHFVQRLDADANLRAVVAFWETELSSLVEEVALATPSKYVKLELMQKLNVQAPKHRWSWGWLAIPTLSVMALVATLVIAPIMREPAFNPTLHATLKSTDSTLHIEAGYAPKGNIFKVIPQIGSPDEGRNFELWVIGANATSPVSLGVIATDVESVFEITSEIAALMEGGILAVSDEPIGGSPTGAPTGRILATGNFFDAKLFKAS